MEELAVRASRAMQDERRPHLLYKDVGAAACPAVCCCRTADSHSCMTAADAVHAWPCADFLAGAGFALLLASCPQAPLRQFVGLQTSCHRR